MSAKYVSPYLILGILSWVLISANIGGLYIYALDEAKNSVCAREMMEMGDLVTPTFNYELRGDKPPLHYYFMILSYRIFGVNEFAARFFSVIMGILTVLMVFRITDQFLSRRSAILSALVLLSSMHFLLQFHMAVPDPYLIFFLTLGWGSFYFLYTSRTWFPAIIMYVSFGLATLTKGPVAIALPGLSIMVFLLFNKDFTWKTLHSLKLFPGIGLYFLVTLPWYMMVHLKTNGEWTRIFFLDHNLGRYTETMEGHGAFFLATPLIVLAGLLPFSMFTVQSVVKGWQKRRENGLILYGLIVALSIILFFTFSKTKLPNYTVPAYPFLAILTGWYLDQLLDRKFSRPLLPLAGFIYLVIVSALPPVLYFLLKKDPVLHHLSTLSWFFLTLPAGAIVYLFLATGKKIQASIFVLMSTWMLTALLFFYFIFPKVDKENPVARTLPFIQPEKPFGVYGLYNPAYSFYIRKPFTPLNNQEKLNQFISANPEGYIITRKKSLKNITLPPELVILAEEKDIFEIPTTVILQIKKDSIP